MPYTGLSQNKARTLLLNDDNIMLFTESAYPCVNSKFPDDEHRIFYTGITRTKENLHIIETGAKYRYEI